MTNKTVGAHSLELLKKTDEKINSIELQQAVHKGTNSKKSYEEEIWTTIDRGCKDTEIQGDFFVIVLVKKERHMQNVVRNLFFYRKSCPTSEFDQTVYKYHRSEDKIEFIWTVPNNIACLQLPIMKHSLPPEQQQLVEMTEAFNRGDLDKYAAKLNKELVK